MLLPECLLAENNLDQLEALIEGGVAAFKCFMGNTFGNLPSPPTGAMLEGFEIVHALRHKNKDADRLANEAMDRGMKR